MMIMNSIILSAFLFTASGARDDIEYLISDLSSNDNKPKERAFQEIKLLGPKAAKAVPALIRILSNDDGAAQEQAKLALIAIGEPTVDPLVTMLGGDKALEACDILRRIGKPAKKAVPALGNLITNKNYYIRFGAAKAIVSIEPANQMPVPVLTEGLERSNDSVKLESIESLIRLSKQQAQCSLALKDIINRNDGDFIIVTTALQLAWDMGASAKPTLPAVEKLLARIKHLPNEPLGLLAAGVALKIDRPNELACLTVKGDAALLVSMMQRGPKKAKLFACEVAALNGTDLPGLKAALKQLSMSMDMDIGTAARDALAHLPEN
jgi:hypothetical protein